MNWKLAPAGVALSAFLLSPATAAANDIFRCVVKETRHISDDGFQITYPRNIYAGEAILADTSSGLVRLFRNPHLFRFEISQHGSNDNGWTLTYFEKGTAKNVILILSIIVYNPPGTPFLFMEDQTVHSGLCDVVSPNHSPGRAIELADVA